MATFGNSVVSDDNSGRSYKIYGDVIPKGLLRHQGNGQAGMASVNRFEAQRSHWFMVDIKPPRGVEPNVNTDPGKGDRFLFQASLSSITLPQETSEVIEHIIGNKKVKMAGAVSYNEGSFTFIDYVDAHVGFSLASWRRMVYNPATDAMGYMADYKGYATIYLATTHHDLANQVAWRLFGLWPSTVVYGSGQDFESPGINKVVATFHYDWAEMVDVKGKTAREER